MIFSSWIFYSTCYERRQTVQAQIPTAWPYQFHYNLFILVNLSTPPCLLSCLKKKAAPCHRCSTSFWSLRPCVFVVLDTGNRIHLWDLGAGDIYPVHGVEFDDKVRVLPLLLRYPLGLVKHVAFIGNPKTLVWGPFIGRMNVVLIYEQKRI